MVNRIQVEIDFHQQDRASVFLESDCMNDEIRQQFGEILLFSCLTLRQLINFGPGDNTAITLADTLPTNQEEAALILSHHMKGVPALVPYQGGSGRKRFIGKLEYQNQTKKAKFQLYQKGFGLLGRTIAFYGPMSVLVLFRYLIERRQGDKVFLMKLVSAARLCRDQFLEGKVNMINQAQIALSIADSVVNEYLIMDIWNNDKLVDVWMKWQHHEVPDSYSEDCLKSYTRIIERFYAVLEICLEKNVMNAESIEEHYQYIAYQSSLLSRMCFLAGLDCATMYRSDLNDNSWTPKIGEYYQGIIDDLLRPIRNVVEILLSSASTSNFSSKTEIQTLILDAWRSVAEAVQPWFVTGFKYGYDTAV